ncbi:MAG: class I SAM-dependent methyltransferase [Planctomycetes bacterium]|nr:class I SAM-dependent methyltransferase [Planctomycetota bacterium]
MEQDADQITLRKILKFAELDHKHILEIGCGDGRITSMIVGKPKTITAIDPDADSIRQAQETVSGVDFKIGSGECLEFSDKCFDLVMFTLSLHHQDCQAALKEATRVLKDEGQILVLEPINDAEIEQVCNFFRDERQELVQAQKAIEDSNLRVENSETFITEWVFENRDELYAWLFEYYDMPYDSIIASQVAEFLDPKLDSKPIMLQDKIVIFSLRIELD